jgi:aminodeoxyfutalosine deaminase
MRLLSEKGIVIEACPVSNVRTGAVPSIAEHPIREFQGQGIMVTVNSDDPSMFGTDMNNEYLQLHRELGFTVQELFQLSLNAVDSSFLPEEERNSLRENFIKEYNDLVDKFESLK